MQRGQAPPCSYAGWPSAGQFPEAALSIPRSYHEGSACRFQFPSHLPRPLSRYRRAVFQGASTFLLAVEAYAGIGPIHLRFGVRCFWHSVQRSQGSAWCDRESFTKIFLRFLAEKVIFHHQKITTSMFFSFTEFFYFCQFTLAYMCGPVWLFLISGKTFHRLPGRMFRPEQKFFKILF